jgi:hypothetical protein
VYSNSTAQDKKLTKYYAVPLFLRQSTTVSAPQNNPDGVAQQQCQQEAIICFTAVGTGRRRGTIKNA